MADSNENNSIQQNVAEGKEAEPPGGQQSEPQQEGVEAQDSGADNPFEIQLSEFKEDPNLINVHQFYPQLEHVFTKTNTKFEEEQDKRTEDAMKEILEESSTFALTDKEDTEVTTDVEETQMSLVKKQEEEEKVDDGEEETTTATDDNNSAIQNQSSDLFSTAVSEETLDKARAKREQSLFQTEEWGAVNQYSPGMQVIIDEKAVEHFTEAMNCKQQKDYEGIIRNLNKAMGLKIEAIFYVERAEAYIQLCDFSSAILNYKRACLLEPDDQGYYSRLAFLYYFQGQSLFDQRLYPEALESFARAAEMNPENTGYHIRSMMCLAALQRHGECLALVNKRLETDNNNPDLYIMRARLHEMFRNTTLCYYDIKDALEIDENHEEAKAMMQKMEDRAQDNKKQAMQLNLLGKHREALQKISIAIETNPAVADFHVLRGTLQRKLGDFNSAIDDFLLALDKCDHNEDSPVYIDSQRQLLLTYNDFAVECFTKGFYEEAIILLNKAIKGEKREKGLYINRGDCFFRQNDFNFALQDYMQALDLDPNDDSIKSRISVIYNEFGVNAYQDKNYSETETKLTSAIQYNPKVGQYYITRARSRYMMENMHGARMDLIMGLLLDPMNDDVISILSRLFPGKSVADVVNSRAADTAKIALRGILNISSKSSTASTKARVSQSALSESGLVDTQSVVAAPKSAATTVWSQADTDISTVDESLLKPGGIPNMKACMQERDFNIKLAVEKRRVHDEIQTVLKERKTLRYGGPRVQPLPPPTAKPSPPEGVYRKERLIRSPVEGPSKGLINYNWRKFTMGIGLADVKDV